MCVSHHGGPVGPTPKEAGRREGEPEGQGTETERLRDGNCETHREAEG